MRESLSIFIPRNWRYLISGRYFVLCQSNGWEWVILDSIEHFRECIYNKFGYQIIHAFDQQKQEPYSYIQKGAKTKHERTTT